VIVSLNMLSFPGLNDRETEVAAWEEFIRETKIDMIQLRNLNIDPDVFWSIIPASATPILGVKTFIHRLQTCDPNLAIGSFSHFVTRE